MPLPHLGHPEGRAALRIVLLTGCAALRVVLVAEDVQVFRVGRT